MTTNEAILWLAMGFMVIIGIWLAALTYLVLKRHRDVSEKTHEHTEKIEEEITEEEVSEPEPPAEEISQEEEANEEETEPPEEEKSE
jgi:hypothetical protein